jgi:hypothetical protein
MTMSRGIGDLRRPGGRVGAFWMLPCAVLVMMGPGFEPWLAPMVWAQSRSSAQPKPAPKFDVASVKPCDPHAPRGTNAGSVYSGRVAYNCEPLTSYIRQAYAMYPDGKYDLRGLIVKIEGGASWVNTDRYQIDAKAEGAPGIGTVSGPMMQALLEDRFMRPGKSRCMRWWWPSPA